MQDNPTLIALATAIVAAAVGWYGHARKAGTEDNATVIAGYDRLCANLRDMIALNNEEIARLREELRGVREEQSAWRVERAGLIKRIEELERINRSLRAQLDELRLGGCADK
jgi:chromosome segregation ATPase